MALPAPIAPFGKHEAIHTAQLDETDRIGDMDEVTATQERYITFYSQAKLDSIYKHLWSAGSKRNISPLHHQKVLCREIILTERSDLHLVWFGRTIYIQPLRNSLLNEHFFNTVVLPSSELYSTVLGFLYSYTKLIVHESDLELAHGLHLVDKLVTWKAWFDFRTAVLKSLASGAERQMHRRYDYGEVRLVRLDYIYRLTLRGLSYFTIHREYSTYFTEFFAVGITLFAIVTVALTAMQVVVGIEGVQEALLETSYRFSIAVLVVVAVFGMTVGVLFSLVFSVNAVRVIWLSFI